ncbi:MULTISPECIES: hypothetical protein [unclassified Methylobacterium]|nr:MULTISPECIES: hypothetical protein [unclassified Methylobacterium]
MVSRTAVGSTGWNTRSISPSAGSPGRRETYTEVIWSDLLFVRLSASNE